MRSAALASLLLCWSALADLRLTAERALSETPAVPAVSRKGQPLAATNGKDFLVVWPDTRSGSSDTLASRVSASGEILDPKGFVIARAMWPSFVRWNGSAYVVATWDGTNTRFTAVTSRGVVSETDPVPFDPEPVRNERGETLESVYRSSGPFIWFIDASGRRLHGFDLPPELVFMKRAIPLGGDDWIVLFSEGRKIFWARLSLTAGLVSLREMLDTSSQNDVKFVSATDGRNVAVGWLGAVGVARDFDRARAQITFGWATADENGEIRTGQLPSEVIEGRYTATYPSHTRFAATADGTAFHFAVTLPTPRNVTLWAIRVAGSDVTSTVVEGPDPPLEFPSDHDAVLVTGERNLLAWRTRDCENLGTRCQIRLLTFPRGGSAADGVPVVLSQAGMRQEEPDAAGGESGMLSVWRDVDAGSIIRGRFTLKNGPAGAVFDVSPYGTMHSPNVAFAGGVHAVVWVDQDGPRGRVMLRRFDAAGNALDANAIALSAEETIGRLDVVARGDAFVVAWLGSTSALRIVNVPRAGAAGAVTLVASPTVSPARRNFVLTSSGDTTALVWSEFRSVGTGITPAGTMTAWRMVRVTGAGTGPVVEFPVISQEDPEAGGDTFAASLSDQALLLAWPVSHRGNGGCFSAQRFGSDGRPLDLDRALIACSETGGLPRGTAAWDGAQWWLSSQSGPLQLHGITAAGTRGGVHEVTPTGTLPALSSLARVPSGLAVSYTRSDDANAGGARRAFLRILTSEPETTRTRAVRR